MNQSVEQRLDVIESRNKRVDGNKNWETSWVRRISIFILTYLTVVVYHVIIDADRIFIISLVPSIGFLLSTLSLQFIRNYVEKRSVVE